jgi:hypothetical protein
VEPVAFVKSAPPVAVHAAASAAVPPLLNSAKKEAPDNRARVKFFIETPGVNNDSQTPIPYGACGPWFDISETLAKCAPVRKQNIQLIRVDIVTADRKTTSLCFCFERNIGAL